MTTEEIEWYIPKTPKERRKVAQEQKDEFSQMKEDVEYLLKQVKVMTEIINSTEAANLLRGAAKENKVDES